MSNLFVRVAGKAPASLFYRCGFAFDKNWQGVEVDTATLKRLHEESMLEVSEEQPTDYVANKAAVDKNKKK